MTTIRNARKCNRKAVHSLQVLPSLSLDLVCEVEVALVELMDSDITILTSRSVSLALWIDCDCVQWTKITVSIMDFLNNEGATHPK